MGFNKKRLPPLEDLKKELADSPERIKSYMNADALIGPVDSANYLNECIKQYLNESSFVPERESAY